MLKCLKSFKQCINSHQWCKITKQNSKRNLKIIQINPREILSPIDGFYDVSNIQFTKFVIINWNILITLIYNKTFLKLIKMYNMNLKKEIIKILIWEQIILKNNI
jgi:hypothetical protein